MAQSPPRMWNLSTDPVPATLLLPDIISKNAPDRTEGKRRHRSARLRAGVGTRRLFVAINPDPYAAAVSATSCGELVLETRLKPQHRLKPHFRVDIDIAVESAQMPINDQLRCSSAAYRRWWQNLRLHINAGVFLSQMCNACTRKRTVISSTIGSTDILRTMAAACSDAGRLCDVPSVAHRASS